MSFLELNLGAGYAPPPKKKKINGQVVGVEGELTGPTDGSVAWRSSGVDEGMTLLTIRNAILMARAGYPRTFIDLATAMELKDLQWRTVTSTRAMAAASVPLEIVQPSAEAKDMQAADLCRDIFSGDWMTGTLIEMMSAVTYGFSVHEIIWGYDGKYLVPTAIKHRDPRLFRFDPQNHERVIYSGGDKEFDLADWPNNFIVHYPKTKAGPAIETGLAMPGLYYGYFKNILLKGWVNYSNVYGTPSRFAKYPRGMKPEKIDDLLAMLQAMGEDSCAVFEDSIKIETLESKSKGSAGDITVYESGLRYMDESMTKLVLGQSLSTDTGQGKGSYALGAVHHATRIDILKADLKQCANTINRAFIRPITELNIGMIENYPQARFNVRENIDVQVQMNALAVGVGMGGRFPQSYLNELLSVRLPKDDEPILLPAVGGADPQGDLTGGLKPAGGAQDLGNAASDNAAQKLEKPAQSPTSSGIAPGQDGPDRAKTAASRSKPHRFKIIKNPDGTVTGEAI